MDDRFVQLVDKINSIHITYETVQFRSNLNQPIQFWSCCLVQTTSLWFQIR